ncbi:MAG: TetR/AcrR family transcriptional regulator [Pseudomonadota bacterium]
MQTLQVSGGAAPDVEGLSFEAGLRVLAEWVENSSLTPAALGLYRANVAAAARFPALAADLHLLRTGLPQIPYLMAKQQRTGWLPGLSPEMLGNWFGVLALGGARHLLGCAMSEDERQAALDEIIHLFSTGWLSPVKTETRPIGSLSSIERTEERSFEEAGRLPAARWEDLLRAAFQSFADRGLRGTSVDDISAVTGVAKMTIYRRFGNKDALFGAAIDQAIEDLLADRPPVVFSPNIASSLVAVALQHDAFARHPNHIRLLRLLITEAETHPAIVQPAWHHLVGPGRRELAMRLKEWRDADLIHLTHPEIAAEQFLIVAGRGNRRLTDMIAPDAQEALQYAQDVVALFLR